MDVPMELSRILIAEQGDYQVIYLREINGERTFPILIGISEVLAIDRRLKDIPTPRPMTHDLLAGVIEAMGGRLEKIVINDIRDHTFIATLHIRHDEELIEVDSRPSDAIALGAAYETPIFVADHVLDSVTSDVSSAKDRLNLLRERLVVLRDGISELTERLADKAFVAGEPEESVQEMRQHLQEMESEYEAIDRILKKLS